MTIAELTVLAQQIRDETNPGANTAVRIGDLFQDIIDTIQERTPIPKTFVTSAGWFANYQGSPSLTEQAVTEDNIFAFQFNILEEVTVDAMGILFRQDDPATTIQWALYDSLNFLPNTKIAGTDFSVLNATHLTFLQDAFTADITLSPGQYWACFLADLEFQTLGTNAGSDLFPLIQNTNSSTLASKSEGSLISDNTFISLPASLLAETYNETNDNIAVYLKVA